MFEGIITNILNRILGDFVEGIKADQLSISLLSGDVELFDLSIKPDILDNMPLPFKLIYGKVGRIFVDVPVTSLLSSPLKIEVSEIFMLVEPKEKDQWNADIIQQAFVNSTQSSLNNLEEYFKGKLEIQNSEPGMATNMINSIIDNVQIDIRNIYLRFEDSISNPKMPYSLGICLEAIQLYTCNNKWMKDFVSGKDISLKMAKITNFQIFLNFAETERGSTDKVKFKDLTEDMHIDDVMDDEIRDIIMKRKEKGVTPSPTIVRTKNFLLEEILSKRKNRNLIEKFCIEARIKLNKDPKKNEKPQLDINLVIGGKFKEGKKELVDDDAGIGFFKLQQQQMKCILKYLDYSTEYTKFQTGVQKKFLERKFSKEESKKYMKIYEEWKMNEGENKSASEKKKAEKLKEEMRMLILLI
jgi:hypothetical protein